MTIKGKTGRKLLLYVCAASALVLLMLYMVGVFRTDKIPPVNLENTKGMVSEPKETGRARVERITEYYEAVGTVQPRTVIRMESQVTAKIQEIGVHPGDRISRGDLLIQLEDSEFQARLDQAKQQLASAEAGAAQARQALKASRAVYSQAEAQHRRVTAYVASQAATQQDLEKARSQYLQAKAGVQKAEDGLKGARAQVKQAQERVRESRIAHGHTRIKAPESGQVVRRLAEPGDLALPGKPLLILQTRQSLRLEALVREGLIHRVSPGSTLSVVVTALNRRLEGTVEEIVPAADPLTRTVLVKVKLPDSKGLLPGMFGRLLVPVSQRAVVAVPTSAVTRIGQLQEVVIRTPGGRWQRIFVKTGRALGNGKIEVLSGLNGTEILGLGRGTDEG